MDTYTQIEVDALTSHYDKTSWATWTCTRTQIRFTPAARYLRTERLGAWPLVTGRRRVPSFQGLRGVITFFLCLAPVFVTE